MKQITLLLLTLLAACAPERAYVLPDLETHAEQPAPVAAIVDVDPLDARYAQPTQVPGLVRELTFVPVILNMKTVVLEALITRPDKPGRHPLLLINHGSPRDKTKLRESSPATFSGQAIWFAQHGYAVASVMRAGFGKSGDGVIGRYGPCDDPTYLRGATHAAQTVQAIADSLKLQPWADPSTVVLVGISTGGLASVAVGAQNPPGLAAVLSFAGGSGSKAPDEMCKPEELVDTMRTFGATSKVPNFWMYAENDHFFGPALARQMRDAYVEKKAPLQFELIPPFKDDGHDLFHGSSPDVWWTTVEGFLKGLNLPTALITEPLPPVSAQAPRLQKSTKEAFKKYQAYGGLEKAFATNGRAFGWVRGKRTPREAIEGALASCGKYANNCFVYSVGDEVTPNGELNLAIAIGARK